MIVFFSLVRSSDEARHARWMIESLRAFGGPLKDSPVWIFSPPPGNSWAALQHLERVECLLLDAIDDGLPHYHFVTKTLACSQAEAMASPQIDSLVWFNPQALVIQPPELFDLRPGFLAALRPVHIRNIGSAADQPLDTFWRTIYERVGLQETPYTIHSFIDGQSIRPYFNTHIFAVDPKVGLLQSWWTHFLGLVQDQEFQSRDCQDPLHQIFLHQAVFSALIAQKLQKAQIHFLPDEYSYPLHLHARIPDTLRAPSLDQLVCPVYEDDESHPLVVQDLLISASLKSWLAIRSTAPGSTR